MKIPILCDIQFSHTAYPHSEIAGSSEAKRQRRKGVSWPAKVMGLSAGIATVQGLISPADAQKLGKIPVPQPFGGAMQPAPAKPMHPIHTCSPGYWLQANHEVEIAVNYRGDFLNDGGNLWAKAYFAKNKAIAWDECESTATDLAKINLSAGSLGYCDHIWFKKHKQANNLWIEIGAQLRFCCPN